MTVHGLFEKQAAISPDRLAVIAPGARLTYRELNERASSFAAYIATYKISPGIMIPTLLEKDHNFIASILGILKAGCAYVPLNPTLPVQRIEGLLKDLNSRLIVADQKINDQLEYNHVLIDPTTVFNKDQNTKYNSGQVFENDIATVMYTSGSSGRPKGVMITHQNITNLVREGDIQMMSKGGILLSTGAISFDATLFEYWSVLLNGGTLVLTNKAKITDPPLLHNDLLSHDITTLWLTASLFNQLTDYNPHFFDSIKYLVIGGERLSKKHVDIVIEASKETMLFNGYGPTENTTFSLMYRIQGITDSIPIGTPLPGRIAYVLNDQLKQCDLGVEGEIFVGGKGLSLGYLNNPELTKDLFITNPFDTSLADRLYKTGDIGRKNADGNIEFVGRMDDQVKIRGHRVELGEIETAILDSGLAMNCAVVLLSGSPGVLVAFVVPADNYNQDGLKKYLDDLLPDFMIPAKIVSLDKIPLTSNGKVDRHKLTQWTEPNTPGRSKSILSPMEQQIAEIWEDILHLDVTEPDSNFFQLGGDSITVIAIVGRLRKAFDLKISVTEVYESSSLAQLAEIVNSRLNTERAASVDEASVRIETQFKALKQAAQEKWNSVLEVEDAYPMSDIQKGMMYTSSIGELESVYHEQMNYFLPLNTNIDLIMRSIGLLVEKHEIFRTFFDMELGDGGVQIVCRKIELPVHFHTILCQPDEIYDRLNSYIQDQRSQHFDGTRVLWKLTFIKLDTHVNLLIQYHHAILDGWSLASFETELNNLYVRLLSQPAPASLLKLKATNRDFIISGLKEKQNKTNIDFWKSELNGYNRLDVFRDEVVQDLHSVTFSNSDLQKILDISTRSNISLKAVLLGAYLLTLSTISGEAEITLGIITHTRPELEDGDKILGCFLNTTPFRMEIKTTQRTWNMFFSQVESKLNKIRAASRTSLLDIAAATGESLAGGNPFFDVTFNLTHFHIREAMMLSEIEQGNRSGERPTGKLDYAVTNTWLDMDVNVNSEGLLVGLLSRRPLTCQKSTKELLDYFKAILNLYIASSDQLINTDEILSADEIGLLLPSVAFEQLPASNIIDMLHIHVVGTPDKTCIVGNGKRLSYHELDVRSNQIANYLISVGVKQEDFVPIFLDKSIEYIIAIFGILKAGAAFIPLDTKFPKAKISQILSDAFPSAIITHSSLLDNFDEHFDKPILAIDQDREMINSYGQQFSHRITSPEHLAYAIYTSGSTGRSKGVMIEHQSVINIAQGWKKAYNLTEDDVVLSLSSTAFDVFVGDISRSLLIGGRMILVSEIDRYDVNVLTDIIQDEEVTFVESIPQLLLSLARHYESKRPMHLPLRFIECGSDVVSIDDYRFLRKTFGDKIRLVNAYGLSETAVDSTYFEGDVSGVETSVPIGRPMQNISCLILNKEMKLTPIGTKGELFIGGISVGRGYVNNATENQKRFRTNPYREGERLFRTGDIAKWNKDGNIELLGRTDNQIKIRGHRIELGEVEKILLKVPGIRRAVAAKKNDSLIAYVVTEWEPNIKHIHSFMKDLVPSYMVPSIIMTVESIKLNTNGKIDRAALEASARTIIGSNTSPPVSEYELIVAKLWTELLKVKDPCLESDFFEIGGNSIILIQLIGRLRGLGFDVPLKSLMEKTTLEDHAKLLAVGKERFTKRNSNPHVLRLTQGNSTPLVFVLPGMSGLTEQYDQLVNLFNSSATLYGLQMMGLFEGERPLTNVRAIAQKNIEWISAIDPHGPYNLIGHSLGGHVLFEMIKLLEQNEKKVNTAIVLDAPTELVDDTQTSSIDQVSILEMFGRNIFQLPEHQLKEINFAGTFKEMCSTFREYLHTECSGLPDFQYRLRVFDLQLANLELTNRLDGVIKCFLIVVGASQTGASDLLKKWSEHARASISLVVNAEHETIYKDEAVSQLANLLNEAGVLSNINSGKKIVVNNPTLS